MSGLNNPNIFKKFVDCQELSFYCSSCALDDHKRPPVNQHLLTVGVASKQLIITPHWLSALLLQSAHCALRVRARP